MCGPSPVPLGKRGATLLPHSLPSNDLSVQTVMKAGTSPSFSCHSASLCNCHPDRAFIQGGWSDALMMLPHSAWDPHTGLVLVLGPDLPGKLAWHSQLPSY